jgi:hypothetical protein
MPLRDHFHPPVELIASWEEVHGMWPGVMAMRLNEILPGGYRCGVKIHLGSLVEVDVGTREQEYCTHDEPHSALAWEAASPTLLLETEELTPPEYEVRVYDRNDRNRLVAAVEIVSPRNKDRETSRDAFVSKCHAMIQQEVCVVIVDPCTDRSANLYADLAERLGAKPPATAESSIYAVSCRFFPGGRRHRIQSWEHPLEIGGFLPTLPLWLTDSLYVPLELERTYEESCKGLRIP